MTSPVPSVPAWAKSASPRTGPVWVIDPVIVCKAMEPPLLVIPAAPTSSAPLLEKLKPPGAEPETEPTVLKRVSTARPADDVALSVGATIDPLGRRTSPGALAISMMSPPAASVSDDPRPRR